MAESSSLYTISIHPLAILNITDHHTRTSVGKGGRVCGMLFGKQTGHHVDIYSSYEACFQEEAGPDGAPVFDTAHFKEAISLYVTVFPGHEMLGWYSTGDSVGPEHAALHRQVTEFNETPWFLFINQTIDPGQKDLPLAMFALETQADKPGAAFVKYPVTIAAFEMERITIDHVSNLKKDTGDTESGLVRSLGSVKTAVGTLSERIALLLAYLKATKDGSIPVDHSLLRQVASICNQLPALDSPAFRAEYLREKNDTLLLTYLGGLTKSAHLVSEVVGKVNAAHSKRGRGIGGMGMPMGIGMGAHSFF